jgi:hypothetical protein
MLPRVASVGWEGTDVGRACFLEGEGRGVRKGLSMAVRGAGVRFEGSLVCGLVLWRGRSCRVPREGDKGEDERVPNL